MTAVGRRERIYRDEGEGGGSEARGSESNELDTCAIYNECERVVGEAQSTELRRQAKGDKLSPLHHS